MYVLASVILAYCAIGVFALHNVVFDIWVMFFFGVVGYFMKKLGFPLAPMILGVVLGKLAELNLARATGISDDLLLFFKTLVTIFSYNGSNFSNFPILSRCRKRLKIFKYLRSSFSICFGYSVTLYGKYYKINNCTDNDWYIFLFCL